MTSTRRERNAAELIQSIVVKEKVIDLTMVLHDSHGTPGEALKISYRAEGVAYYKAIVKKYDTPTQSLAEVLFMSTHIGTHMDAPPHLIPPPNSGLPHAGPAGEITVEKVPVSQLMGPAAVIDCQDLIGNAKPGMSPIISVEKIRQWEKDYGEITEEDVVLFHTGWSDRYYEENGEYTFEEHSPHMRGKREGHPAPGREVMLYLADKGVKHVGGDFPSTGPVQADPEPHWAGLGKGMVLVEKLVNLGKLPPRGAYYIFLPLRLENASGSPGRAIAIV